MKNVPSLVAWSWTASGHYLWLTSEGFERETYRRAVGYPHSDTNPVII